MNVSSLINDMNPGKLLVHCSTFSFVILFALKLDKIIECNWYVVFLPIWIWKAITITAAVLGIFVFCKYPHYRIDGGIGPDSYIQFKAMLISFAIQLILLIFEILVCDHLSSGRHLWIIVFIPLILASLASIRACIWSVKHDRSFELELFLAVNTLQFIALPLKLDHFVNWTWEVVFVPMWIVVCLCLVSALYNMIFCGIMLRTPEIPIQQKKTALQNAIGNACAVVPLLCFQVIIADKLEGIIKLHYILVFSPLLLTLLSLIVLSFNSKRSNKWWFGIRKNVCQFILTVLPFLQEYGNVSYRIDNSYQGYASERGQAMQLQQTLEQVDECTGNDHQKANKADLVRHVVPLVSIYTPD